MGQGAEVEVRRTVWGGYHNLIGDEMRKWILHYQYPGEGSGSALPFLLSDREKGIIEKMEEVYLIDSMRRITFVETKDGQDDRPPFTGSE